MGATNTTANYSLSQFIGTDKPAWLQDYNGDMLKIDTGINAAKVAADGAQNAASAAQNDATTANNAITNTINPAISSLNTTVGNQGGAINTINSLIGNGTPTTTDQTIIGAINEINDKTDYDTPDITITSGSTMADKLNSLATQIDLSKLTARSVIMFGDSVVRFVNKDPDIAYFMTSWATDSRIDHIVYIVKESDSAVSCAHITSGGATFESYSSRTASGITLKLYY